MSVRSGVVHAYFLVVFAAIFVNPENAVFLIARTFNSRKTERANGLRLDLIVTGVFGISVGTFSLSGWSKARPEVLLWRAGPYESRESRGLRVLWLSLLSRAGVFRKPPPI